jgi:serine/threonine-protein kinase
MVAGGSPPSTEHPHPEHPLVGLRYRIIRRLGDGGFGCTYLAEDEQRFREPWVLKEFAPKVEGAAALRKA